ncbi:MAG: hypothetical protein LQ349_005848 [Xanthoria aureola]|nr:MAG: hypothetical protein LQ349_005848 [Xanthoria aureola]
MTQSPEWADKGSEPLLVAERSIGWHGFACGVDNNGCDKRPNCDDVLTRLGDKDEARWVYFVLESMHYMTKISAAIAVGGDAIDRLRCPFANAPKGLEEETRLQIKADMVKFYQNNLFLSPGTLLANVIKSGEYVSFTPEQAARFERQGFEPEDEKFCRARCWQNWKGNKKLELFGLKKMEQDGNGWGIETQAFLTGSYDHYKAHSFRADPLLPSQEDFYNDNDTPRPTSGSFLPVCDIHLSPPKQQSRHSGIPCMCGDQYGSGTAPFLDAANFASWKAVAVTEGDSYTQLGPIYLCQNDMAKSRTPPVEYFLPLCHIWAGGGR